MPAEHASSFKLDIGQSSNQMQLLAEHVSSLELERELRHDQM